jgi:hypothetical protein
MAMHENAIPRFLTWVRVASRGAVICLPGNPSHVASFGDALLSRKSEQRKFLHEMARL